MLEIADLLMADAMLYPLALLVLAFLSVAIAASTLPAAFVCEFSSGFFSTPKSGRFATSDTQDTLRLTFASIDQGRQKAQMIGNAGAADVLLFGGLGVVHFVEFTPVGNITVTTVYLPPSGGGPFYATHSRHVGSSDEPMISQYLGFCEARWP